MTVRRRSHAVLAVVLLLAVVGAPSLAQEKLVGNWVCNEDITYGVRVKHNDGITYVASMYDVHRGPEKAGEGTLYRWDGASLVYFDGDLRIQLSYAAEGQQLVLDRTEGDGWGGVRKAHSTWRHEKPTDKDDADKLVHTPERAQLLKEAQALLGDRALWFPCHLWTEGQPGIADWVEGLVRVEAFDERSGEARGVLRADERKVGGGNHQLTAQLAESLDERRDVLSVRALVRDEDDGDFHVVDALTLRRGDGGPKFVAAHTFGWNAMDMESHVDLSAPRGRMDLAPEDFRRVQEALSAPEACYYLRSPQGGGDVEWLAVDAFDRQSGVVRGRLCANYPEPQHQRHTWAHIHFVGLLRDDRFYVQPAKMSGDLAMNNSSQLVQDFGAPSWRIVFDRIDADEVGKPTLVGYEIVEGDVTRGELCYLHIGSQASPPADFAWGPTPDGPWPTLDPADFEYPLRPWKGLQR